MMVALFVMVSPGQTQGIKAEVASDFTDVSKSSWAYKSIMTIRDEGVIDGYPDNTFRPEEEISRVHTALLLSRSIDLQPIRDGKEFNDVPKTNAYYDAIQKVYRAGIFDGKANGDFGINDVLTRGKWQIRFSWYGRNRQQWNWDDSNLPSIIWQI